MNVQIRFWWPGYSPEEALDSFDLAVTEMAFEVSRDGGRTWRPPHNGATLSTVHDWMVDHGLAVVNASLTDQRRNSQWEGQYVLTLGQSQEDRHAQR